MRILALLDGDRVRLADPDLPHIRIDDLGLQRGDGVFETALTVHGEVLELDAHLERLARSAAMLDLPPPDVDAWRRCAAAVVDAWTGGPEMLLKLVHTRGPDDGSGAGRPTGFALGYPVPESTLRHRRDGVSAITLEGVASGDLAERAPWLLIGAKTLSYAVNMAALRYAEAGGADDAIMVSADGFVLEAPTANVIVANGRTLRTPPHRGILPGTTQGLLFRCAAEAGWTVLREPLRVADLHAADGVWLSSSGRLLTRVHTLDGTALPDNGLTAELAALLPVSVTGCYSPSEHSRERSAP